MIYWDLDGVLRDLHHVVFPAPASTWDEKINGKGFCDHIDENLSLLESAPKHKYCEVALKQECICIMTCQPKAWRLYTSRWIHKHLGGMKKLGSIEYFDKPEHKLERLRDGDILIDDNPNLEDYSKVWLIDYPYNKKVWPLKRITSPKQLEKYLKERG